MVKFVASVFILFVVFFVCVCVCGCVCICVFRGDIRAPFLRRDKVPNFLTITLVSLRKP